MDRLFFNVVCTSIMSVYHGGRRASDDSVVSVPRPCVFSLRSHSADDIRSMHPIDWSFSNLRDATIFRNRSEGDHLALAIRRVIARREEAQAQSAREIYQSRSLFDSRVRVPILLSDERSSWSSRIMLRLVWLVRVVEHYFIPLQLGIVTALIWANVNIHSYEDIWGESTLIHYIINDVFMALFFGVATVHVTTALMEGGALYPLNKALTPLLATLGGVAGPVCVYLTLVSLQGVFETESSGWAACIATDISIAWLISVQVFGAGGHPAVQFLLLLAVVDDVIGLVVIAVFFPQGDLAPIWILMILGSVLVTLFFRFVCKFRVWYPYILISGPLAWYGLYMFGVHPALALCFVVPLIPGHENLAQFDHNCALIVHLGLFFFALCNAGVVVTHIGLVTMNIALSTIIGKTLGIFLFAWAGIRLAGLTLPEGMNYVHLGLMSHISGVGLTVSLFVIQLAFTDSTLRDEAKLGALFTLGVAPVSLIAGRLLKVQTSGSVKPMAKPNPHDCASAALV